MISRLFPLLLISAAALLADVGGTVTNRTSGVLQAEAVVTLYSLGQSGMSPVKTVKSDAQGAFLIPDYVLQGPHLLQTIHAGVIYNKMIQAGASAFGLDIEVFDSSPDSGQVSVTQHMVLIEPMGEILHINESIVMRNAGNTTYDDSGKGTLQVYIPTEMKGTPRLMVTAPQGMPVQRDPVAVGDAGDYRVDFPIKPGETRFDLTYVVPDPDPRIFNGKVLHGGGPVRLVAPVGVTFSGDGLTQVGEEPQTLAKVYEASSTEYSVAIEGTGTLNTPEAAAPQGGGPGVQPIRARVYDRVALIVGLAFAILICGFLLLYRRPESLVPAPSESAPAAPKAKGKRK